MGKHAAPRATKIPLVLQLALRAFQLCGRIDDLVDLVEWLHRIM